MSAFFIPWEHMHNSYALSVVMDGEALDEKCALPKIASFKLDFIQICRHMGRAEQRDVIGGDWTDWNELISADGAIS